MEIPKVIVKCPRPCMQATKCTHRVAHIRRSCGAIPKIDYHTHTIVGLYCPECKITDEAILENGQH